MPVHRQVCLDVHYHGRLHLDIGQRFRLLEMARPAGGQRLGPRVIDAAAASRPRGQGRGELTLLDRGQWVAAANEPQVAVSVEPAQ